MKVKSSKLNNKKTVIFIVGPTAVGKSEVAVELAKKIKAEIISCDAMQVYKDMDIITQQPPKRLMNQVPHHLIGILRPDKNFSVADFRKMATAKIKGIHKRKKIPVVVGGSGLYVKGLLDGLFPSPPADEKLRNRLLGEEKTKGKGFLYERLKIIDPPTASRVHPNDLRRIIRALEIYKKTKTPVSVLKRYTKGLLTEGYNIEMLGLTMPREQLYKRADERVDEMFKAGLVEQVKNLDRYNLSKTAQGALGIKEIKDYLSGKYSLEDARYLLKRNTRRFVKKQLTWFRPDKRITWINIDFWDKTKDIARKILDFLKT